MSHAITINIALAELTMLSGPQLRGIAEMQIAADSAEVGKALFEVLSREIGSLVRQADPDAIINEGAPHVTEPAGTGRTAERLVEPFDPPV